MILGGHDGGSGDSPVADKKEDKHKQTIIVIASVLGVAIAYLTYRHAAANAANGTGSAAPAVQTGVSGDTDTSGDDSGSDDMNAISSGFATLSQQLASIVPTSTTTTAAPKPVAKVVPTFDLAHASADEYIQNKKTKAIYQVNPTTGAGYHLDPAQWASIKAKEKKTPKVVQYG